MISEVLRPWRQSLTWWRLVHVCLDLPVGAITFSVVFTLATLTLSLAVIFPVAIITGWLLLVSSRVMGHIERTRAVSLLGIELTDPVPPLVAGNWFRRLAERLRSRARWYELAYMLVRFPLGIFTAIGTIATWSIALMLASLPVLTPHLPGGTAKLGFAEVAPGPVALAAGVIGVVGLVLVAPWVTVAMASLDAFVVRRLLGGPDEMSQRLAAAEAGRSAAVDSAEAERRRIERDLHDGAQQRLVALAMDLGRARQRFETDPEGARELVEGAHEEAKSALGELRQLVRGIHPAILADRGLDAALSSVVARCPVPVALEVDLTQRLPAAVESAAYFVVTEALTNVARHSRAERAWVHIAASEDVLVVEVGDDGVGGAHTDGAGTGLAGLAERLAALGGTLSVSSPDGGPTVLRVEVPCGS